MYVQFFELNKHVSKVFVDRLSRNNSLRAHDCINWSRQNLIVANLTDVIGTIFKSSLLMKQKHYSFKNYLMKLFINKRNKRYQKFYFRNVCFEIGQWVHYWYLLF